MKHSLEKIATIPAVVFLLISSLTLSGQVIESGFGYSSLLQVRRGGLDNNNDGFADETHCQLISSKRVDPSDAFEIIYEMGSLTGFGEIISSETFDYNCDGIDDYALLFAEINDNYDQGKGLFIYNGSTGEQIFGEEYDDNISIADIKCGDFDFDGRGELLIAVLENDALNIILLDLYPQIKKSEVYSLDNIVGININVNDLNGDTIPDLLAGYQHSDLSESEFVLIAIDIINETKQTNTWVYEFPEVLKLVISASISFVIGISNAIISYFDLYEIFS